MLKEPTVIACCMVKTPLKLMRKSASTPLFFTGLIGINYVIISLFILPFYDGDWKFWFFFDSAIIALTFLMFTLSACTNPGYLKKPENISFLTMLKNFDPVLLCPDCQIIRTQRSRHCSICNQCVERFDHHCPWINNCVGIGNHHYFMIFLLSVVTLLVSVLTTMASVLSREFSEGEVAVNSDCFLAVFPYVFYQKGILISLSLVVLITSVFFILPVLLLGFIQLRNFCANKTTNERFARRANSTASERSNSDRTSSYQSSRSSSVASSLSGVSGHRQSVTSVQEILDSQNRTCGCMFNCYQMCCNRQMVD